MFRHENHDRPSRTMTDTSNKAVIFHTHYNYSDVQIWYMYLTESSQASEEKSNQAEPSLLHVILQTQIKVCVP